jgi:ubiquinone/menaquinone biosynthesis C-methylase UbiE
VKPDVVGDVQSLPCEDNSFDIILCTEVLEHVQDPRRAIAEMHRVLRPGGRLVLTTRFLFPIHHPSHDFFRFTEAGLQSLFAGWNTFTIRPEASSFETIAILLQRMILQMRFRFNKLTKAVLLLLISFFLRSTWLIKDEYPHIEANTVSANIFSSGYYVVATK